MKAPEPRKSSVKAPEPRKPSVKTPEPRKPSVKAPEPKKPSLKAPVHQNLHFYKQASQLLLPFYFRSLIYSFTMNTEHIQY